MKNNGHRRPYEFAFEIQARRLPPPGRPSLLSILRRLTARHPQRTFWILDPATGEWRSL